jgi:hypothetical protein
MTTSLIWLVALIGQASDSPDLTEKEVTRILEPYFQQQAAEYEFFLDESRKQKLEHVAKPAMRWTALGNYGTVWVWTRQGRPEVVGCLGAYLDQNNRLNGFHEFHSLTLKPLQKVQVGKDHSWQSRNAGVDLKLLNDADAPAANDKLRLIQMRALARDFTAMMRSDEKTHTLRLATTPLYRYQSSNLEVLDGALFSFLWDNGTDPEFLLLLEARQTPDGQRWHYAPVRFTTRELWLVRDGKELWRVPASDEFWTSRILRDSYASCATGVLDLEVIKNEQEPKK